MAGLGNFVPASRPAWGLQAAAAAARPPLPPPGARLFPASRGCSVRAGPAAGDGASGSLGRCPWHSHPVWAKGLLPACAALPGPHPVVSKCQPEGGTPMGRRAPGLLLLFL